MLCLFNPKSLTPIMGAALLSLPLPLRSAGDDSFLQIQVRAEVERRFTLFGRKPATDAGNAYFIASLQQADSLGDLVVPVDEDKLRRKLIAALASAGFDEATPDETPALALTVLYGRGWLRNPYRKGAHMDSSTGVPTVTYTGLPTHLVRQKTHRHEEREQSAESEKLFIRVTAWANPDTQARSASAKKPKPRELWQTTLITDDPEHRDLNQFVDKLLAAGVSFFGQETKNEEEVIHTTLPEGFVRYGEIKWLEPEDSNDAPELSSAAITKNRPYSSDAGCRRPFSLHPAYHRPRPYRLA